MIFGKPSGILEAMGNTVGSLHHEVNDPVTTEDESLRFGQKTLSHARVLIKIINPFYVSGHVDGEGCFTVSFSPRDKLRVKWEVRPSFSVSQNADRAEIIYLLVKYFGCGTVRPDRSDKTLKYEVRGIKDLIDKIIPHFEKYPLQSSKQKDFEYFAEICRRVYQGMHLLPQGLAEIQIEALKMNPSGKRKYKTFSL